MTTPRNCPHMECTIRDECTRPTVCLDDRSRPAERKLPLPPPPPPPTSIPGPGVPMGTGRDEIGGSELVSSAFFAAVLLVGIIVLCVVLAAQQQDRMRERVHRLEVQVETVRNMCEERGREAGTGKVPDRSER